MSEPSAIVRPITSAQYVHRFIDNLPRGYQLQNTPLQVYELASLSSYLKVPTPLLKPDYNFLVHVSEGYIKQQVGTEVITINAPAILIVSHSYATALLNVSELINGYYILIENKALNMLMSDSHLLRLFDIDPVLQLTQQSNEWFNKLNHLLYTELSGGQPDRATSNALAQAVLHKVIALSDKGKNLTTAQMIALKFKKLAYQHYIQHKDAGFYAEKLNISNNYLSRCVRGVLGKTVKEIILEICVLQSQLLLQDTSRDIGSVAYDLNFDDPSYWGRLFKKMTGRTPSQYRKEFMHD